MIEHVSVSMLPLQWELTKTWIMISDGHHSASLFSFWHWCS
ncbi:hypothetical protein V6Z12_D05G439700 [Gossypium hirsutum]